MEKMKMHSMNKINENVKKIAALFPECITEIVNDKGELETVVDIDAFRQLFSKTAVEGNQERYQFTWPDKRKARALVNQEVTSTLRPCREESVNFDTTENLYIEGDNLEVLKLLQETYLGKIKMIYIDPPYNTGHDFVYEDDFSQNTDEYISNSGQYDDQGKRLVANTESNGRFHTDWLNMIYPRLKLARDLLTDDGAIFISIDDNECANLIKVCEEIYGSNAFVADISWQRTYSTRNDSQGIVKEIEHLICYSRHDNWNPKKLPRTEDMNSIYQSPDGDLRPWTSSSVTAPGAKTHQGMVYAIQHPFTGEMMYPTSGRCWALGQEQMLIEMNKWCSYHLSDINDIEKRAEICGISPTEVKKGIKAIILSNSLEQSKILAEKILTRGNWPYFYFTNNGNGGLRRKTYLDEMSGRLPTNFWSFSETGHTDEAKKEIKQLFEGDIPFDTPKPIRFIDRMLAIASDKNSIILDFFSGSATTAHAVMKRNVEDGGHRKFIMVQVAESSNSPKFSSICEIGKERIRRAGKQILEEMKSKNGDLFSEDVSLDVGFRDLKLDSSNMNDVYYTPDETDQRMLDGLESNIKEDRTAEDLLFQVMLDLGVLLSAKIVEEDIGGKKVFNVGDNYLIACFDEDVDEAVIMEAAKKKPTYFVMRDSSLANDSVSVNFDQIFARYSPDTVRKVL